MAAQRIQPEVAEAVALHHMSEQPSIASMCQRWQLSRPTVKAIIDGKHPSLSAKMCKKLGKPVQSVTANVARARRMPVEQSSLKNDLANLVQQMNAMKKTITTLARQHA